MAGLLSPLQLQAAAGLFQNQGLDVNANLTATVDAYTSTPLLANLIAAIGNASSLPGSTQLLLQTFANTSCPALADSIVANIVAPVSTTLANPGMSGIITLTAEAYMGNVDLSVFAQNFIQANSYIYKNLNI